MDKKEGAYICCFIGHRKLNQTKDLIQKLELIIEDLHLKEKVNYFLFGSKSEFNDICYTVVSKLKEKYPNIKRIYVRAEYPDINNEYMSYLLKYYDDTYYPQEIKGAGRLSYVKRNFNMINKSDFCVIYYSDECLPKTHKSGTELALKYAVSKNKNIILLP